MPFCAKASFLLTVNGRLSPPKSRRFAAVGSDTRLRAQSFRCIEKKMGVYSRAAKRRIPVPAPWADFSPNTPRRPLHMKKLNEILGTEFPIIQGGMANIATGEFAAA